MMADQFSTCEDLTVGDCRMMRVFVRGGDHRITQEAGERGGPVTISQ
jgi:hypothetical protein